MTLLVYKFLEEWFQLFITLVTLDSNLLHYLLSPGSKSMTTLQKGVPTPYISVYTFHKKKLKTSLLLNHIKGNTSRFGSAIQVLHSLWHWKILKLIFDYCCCSYFYAYFYYWKLHFFIIVNLKNVRNKVWLDLIVASMYL